jgi:CheY-like chemotaxis protein
MTGTLARVLVIDDELTICRVVARALEGTAHITAVSDGRAGLMALCADGAFYAVVCDLHMPHLDGMDLYELVQAARPAQARRFVFLTGGARSQREAHFLLRVAAAVIDKPFRVRALQEVVASVIRGESAPR